MDPWSSDAWNNDILNDPRVNAYIFNNRLWDTARAPAQRELSNVRVARFSTFTIRPWTNDWQLRVEGSHYYYDPLTLVTQPLGRASRATATLRMGFEWQ